MFWGTLLAATVVGNPPTYVVYHYGPDMCCLAAAPAPMFIYDVPCMVQTIPSAAHALVPVPVDPPTATAAVVQDKTQANKTDESVLDAVNAEEEGDEESMLEDAAFGMGGRMPGHTLDHLALGWGVSTIGNGTLYPTPFGASGGGGFAGWGGGGGGRDDGSNQGMNWNYVNNVLPPINITCPGCAPPGTSVTPPGPNEVPEPASLAVWALLVAGGIYAKRRRNG